MTQPNQPLQSIDPALAGISLSDAMKTEYIITARSGNGQTLDIPPLKYGVGAKAYLDTFAFGLVPCVVTAIDVESGLVMCKVTANRGGYHRGETVQGTLTCVVPRSHVFTRGYTYRIRTNYEWANL